MNYGETSSRRSHGCIIRLLVIVVVLLVISNAIRSCTAQIDAEAQARAAIEATRKPSSAEQRSGDIRDWMLCVGYESAEIIASNVGESIVEGSFQRDGITYRVRIADPTPVSGDEEQIYIWATNEAGDVAPNRLMYYANGAPTPETAYDNFMSGTVRNCQ